MILIAQLYLFSAVLPIEMSNSQFFEHLKQTSLDFFAGWLGGMAGVLVGHPFDTVKARLQTQKPVNGTAYKGTLHCFRQIVQKESAFGLYKGISSPLTGLAFINAVVFAGYGTSLRHFSRLFQNKDDVRTYFCAGAMAGLLQSFLCSPMELVKLQLQLQGKGVWTKHIFFFIDPPLPYSGPIDCLRKIHKSHGIRGVFKGLPLTVLRDCPCFGIYFSSYEYLTRYMSRHGQRPLTTTDLLLAGGTAGMTSWLFLYPVDVVKSRVQADLGATYRSAWHCVQHSYQRDGWRVFGRGLAPTLLRAFPVNAITFLVVEWVFRLANGFGGSADGGESAAVPQPTPLKTVLPVSSDAKAQHERQAAMWWFLADSKAAMLESAMNWGQ